MTHNLPISRRLLALIALAAAFALGGLSARALTGSQPSAVSFGDGFTYQGFLTDSSGSPRNGSCDFTFELFDAPTGGNQVGATDTITGTAVSKGIFTVVLNESNEFGPAAFNGGGRWLSIGVKCTGDSTTTTLTPRQPITPVPYAFFAERFAGYENIIIVAKQGGDFATVVDAVNAIGVDSVYPAASANNRYLIYVAPGIYDDGRVIMKNYVDLEGAGQGVTVITSNAGTGGISSAGATLVGAANSEVSHLTVENKGDPANWSYALYTAQNSRFTHVTGRSLGGSRSRGMVVASGGAPILEQVTLDSQGSTVSSIALDIVNSTAEINGLRATAGGGQYIYGLFLNTASSTISLKNVTAAAAGGTIETNGFYVTASPVELSQFDVVAGSTNGRVAGLICANSGSRLDARQGTVRATGGDPGNFTYGILATNCDLTTSGVAGQAENTGIVYGGYFGISTAAPKEFSANQLQIQANSTQERVYGLFLTGSAPFSGSGRLRDVEIQASGNITSTNSYGVFHRLNGDFQYQDLTVDLAGKGNFMYGIQASRGAPIFRNVAVNATVEATTTIFGLEFITPVSGGSVEQGRFIVENTAKADAVGLKNFAPESFNYRDIESRATGAVGIWAYHFVNGIVTASDLTGMAVGTADDAFVYGISCEGGGATAAEIHNASIIAQASDPALSPTAIYGVLLSSCPMTLAHSSVRTEAASGSRYGLLATGTPGQEVLVHHSYLKGQTGTVRLLANTTLAAVNSQLDGGPTTAGAGTSADCTGVSHGSGLSFSFLAGPSPCP